MNKWGKEEETEPKSRPLFQTPVSLLLTTKERMWKHSASHECCNPIRANEISFESQKRREIVVRWGEEPEWVRVDSQEESWWKGGDPPRVSAIYSSPSLCLLPCSPLCWFPLSIRSILLLWALIYEAGAQKHSLPACVSKGKRLHFRCHPQTEESNKLKTPSTSLPF